MADETKKVILDISVNADQFIQKIVIAKDKITLLKKENQVLNAEAKKAFETGLFEEYDELTRKIVQNENAQKIAKTEQARAQKQLESFTLATKAAAGSYEQLYQQWKISDAILKNLEGTLERTAEGTIVLTEEFTRAKAETERAKEALNQFGLSTKDGRLNVGNYTEALTASLNKFPLFTEGLSSIRDGLAGVKGGLEVVRNGIGLFSAGTSQLTDAVGMFNESMKSGVTQAVTFAKSLVGIKSQAAGVAAVGVAGVVAGTGLTVGAQAANVFRLALISTGVGAIVVAVGTLIAFFAKTKEGAEKLEVAFGAIGGVIGSLVKTFGDMGKVIFEALSSPKELLSDLVEFLKNTVIKNLTGIFNILKGIATLDFSTIKKGAGEVGEAVENLYAPAVKFTNNLKEASDRAIQAAKDMAKITQEQQALDDQIRENNALNTEAEGKIKAILAATKDQALTDAARLEKLKEAGVIEEAMEKRKLAATEKQLELLDREIAIKGIDSAMEEKRAELANDVAKIKADSLVLTADLRAKESKFEAELLKAQLDGEKQLAEARIRSAELRGADTTQLRIEAARLERDSLLTQEGLTATQILAIRQDFQNKLLEIDRQGFEKRQALNDQLKDLSIARIVDDQTQEIEQEKVNLERRLREIKGNSQAETELRAKLLEETALKIQDIATKFEAQNLAERQQKLKANVDQQIADIEDGERKRLNALELSQSKELNLLRVKLEKGQITQAEFQLKEQEFNEQQFVIEQETLTKKLELQTIYAATRQLNDQKFYDDQLTTLQENLAQELISQEEFNARKAELDKERAETKATTEIETKALVAEAIAAIEDAEVKHTVDSETKKTDAKIRAQKSQEEINKAMVADAQGVAKDLADLLAKDEASRKKHAKAIKALASAEVVLNLQKELSGIFTSAAVTAGETGIYGAIVAYALAAIQAGIATARAFDSLGTINSQTFAEGGLDGEGKTMSFAKVLKQHNPSILHDFQGGMVDKPVMWKLAGEVGPEYVAPTWQVAANPALFRELNQQRKSRVIPYADGGFTQSQVAPTIGQAQTQEATFTQAMNNMPPIFVTVEDFNKVQNRVNVLENRSSI